MLFLTIFVQAGCSKKEPAQQSPVEVKPAQTVNISNEHNTDLEGTWKCKYLSEGTSEVPSTVIATMSLRFSGDTVSYLQGGTTVMNGKYVINEKTSPKELDLIIENGDEKIQIPAIFEIKQSTLKISNPQAEEGNRPTNFEVSEMNSVSIFDKVKEF